MCMQTSGNKLIFNNVSYIKKKSNIDTHIQISDWSVYSSFFLITIIIFSDTSVADS